MTSPDNFNQAPLPRTVPQEQYDALKAKFIEEQTSTKRRLESIDELEALLKKQSQHMQDMEREYEDKLDKEKLKQDEMKKDARE